MRKPKKKQFGGFSIDPSLGGLLNGIDLDNLNFAQVADLGSQIGGDPFNQAMAQDDPSLLTNSFVQNASLGNTVANDPRNAAKDSAFYRLLAPHITQQNTTTATTSAQDTLDSFANLQSIFNFIGNFKKGGSPSRLQKGGKPSFSKFLETVAPDFRDTTHYNLQEAFEELPINTLKQWAKNPDKHHLPDTYKLPSHPTFSIESKYYRPGMKAGYWDGENYIPLAEGEMPPEMELGGKAKLGYSDKSPFKNEPQITIPGGNIDMSQTRMPLMAYPDIGKPKLMQPYSGTHLFPDANKVVEVPAMQQGGKPTFVTDPNDPRYIAYQDSLRVYNKYEKAANQWDSEGFPVYNIGKGEFTQIAENITENGYKYSQISDAFRSSKDESELIEFMRKIDFPDTEQNPISFATVDGTGPRYPRFRKPDQPVELRKPRPKVNIKELPPVSINELSKERPLPEIKVENSFFKDGQYIQDWPNVPNLKIVSKHRKSDGALVPVAIENEKGKRIQYRQYKDKAMPKGFQYPEMMMYGGKKKNKKKIPYYQEGGQPVPQGVQLEDDEVILTPNLDILDTAARDSHKKMDSKTVTDIMRPEDYVLSNKLKITKKEAEKMSLGFGAMLYKEGQIPNMPEEKTIADMFRKGEESLTLAEYGKRVRKKLPVTDKEDVFSLKTNDANRAARLPFLAAAVYKNEMKRTKGKPDYALESSFANPYETSFGAQAGITDEGMSVMGGVNTVPQMPDGGPLDFLNPIGTGINIATGLFDAFIGAPKRKRTTLNALAQDDKAINTLAGTQGSFATAATGAALAGYAGQDPTVNAPQYDSSQLDARIRRAPRTLFDYASGRAMAGSRSFQESLFNNAGSFSQAANAYAPVHAQNAGMLANLGLQEANMNIGLENQYRDMKQSFNDRQTLSDTTARNATRTNTNALTAGVAGTLSGGISTQGSIESNRQNALRSNNLQKAQAKNNASSQGVQAAYGIGNAVSMLPADFFKPDPITPIDSNLPYIPEMQRPVTTINYGPNQPLAPTYGPMQSGNIPFNQQGSTIPLGPNYQYDASTGLWFPR